MKYSLYTVLNLVTVKERLANVHILFHFCFTKRPSFLQLGSDLPHVVKGRTTSEPRTAETGGEQTSARLPQVSSCCTNKMLAIIEKCQKPAVHRTLLYVRCVTADMSIQRDMLSDV